MDAFLLPDTNVQGQVVVELAAKYRLAAIHALSHVVTEWVASRRTRPCRPRSSKESPSTPYGS
jgi:hypothetical protein